MIRLLAKLVGIGKCDYCHKFTKWGYYAGEDFWSKKIYSRCFACHEVNYILGVKEGLIDE